MIHLHCVNIWCVYGPETPTVYDVGMCTADVIINRDSLTVGSTAVISNCVCFTTIR